MILNDTSVERHHGCSRVMDNLYRSIREYDIDIFGVSYLNGDLDSGLLISRLDECDFAIINGEGTIHHDKPYAEKMLRRVAHSNAQIKVLLNTTYDSNPDHYKNYLDKFDHIFVRDTRSQSELDKIAVKSVVVPDLTFQTQSDSTCLSRTGVTIVCSVDREISSHLRDLGRKLDNSRPLSIFAKNRRLTDRLIEIRKSLAVKDLLSPGFLLKMALTRKWFDSCAVDQHGDFFDRLAQSEFLVCGRYHAVCMAIKSRTPFVCAESNTHKISALLHDIGIEKRCLSKADFLASEDIRLTPFSANEIQVIGRYNEEAELRIREMFAQIFKND